MPTPDYPFLPKSTKTLKSGHFWSIPLDNGYFACGRVIQLAFKENGKQDVQSFLAGLMNWTSKRPPSAESIAGCKTIEQGSVSIKTIRENGGEITGFRPLEEDGIEPQLFLSHYFGPGCLLQRGYEVLREATKEEQKLYPVFSSWGYLVIKVAAEKHFGDKSKMI